jgi:pimeloyl-ACP methyl ester carboxylesterase
LDDAGLAALIKSFALQLPPGTQHAQHRVERGGVRRLRGALAHCVGDRHYHDRRRGRAIARRRPIRSSGAATPQAEGEHRLKQETIRIAGVDLELFTGGAGSPVLFLHSGQGFIPEHRYVALLAKDHRLIAPSHPGFGQSALPDWIDNVGDIAHLYLELMDRLKLDRVALVGASIGGWIAAEIASTVPERISKLVLVGPVGVKLGPPDKLDVPDIFVIPQDAANKLMFHDPEKFRLDPAKLTDAQLATAVRNRETLALLVWEPYMHNPKLKHRLHRATMPALFLRGASDGLISQGYLEGYANLLPQARTGVIAEAGHAPQVEQPERFADAVLSFLGA